MEELKEKDFALVKQCIYGIIDLIDDMYHIWHDATRVNDIEIRHSIMRNMSEEIYVMMTAERALDRAVDTVIERNAVVFHAEE